MLEGAQRVNKGIVIYIFAPLLLTLFFIRNISLNFAYFIFLIQCIVFLCAIKKIRFSYREKQFIIFLLLFFLFIMAVFSSLFSDVQLAALRASFIVFVPSLWVMFLVFSDDSPFKTLQYILKVLMYIGILFSIIAIFVFLFGSITKIGGKSVLAVDFGPVILYQVIMGQAPFYRLASLMSNPNSLGIVLMFSQISTIYLYKIKHIKKCQFWFFYFIIIGALVLTQSRGAMFTSVMMVFLFYLVNSNTVLEKMRIIFGTFIFFIISYYLIVINKIGVLKRMTAGLTGREQAWKIILNNVKDNPFIGAGFGLSGDLVTYDLGIKAHNVYLNVLAEIGVIGFVFFCLFWMFGIICSFRGIKKYKNDLEKKYTYLIIFVILFSLMFHGIIESKLLVYDFVMFFWVYLVSLATLDFKIMRSG